MARQPEPGRLLPVPLVWSLWFRRLGAALAVALSLGGLTLLAGGSVIPAKAALAQWLIAQSWRQVLAGAEVSRPWPWADTYPVARLQADGGRFGKIDLYVLAGGSGRTLAFGPGHHDGTEPPGQLHRAGAGPSLIGGHRDTHFRFLQQAKPGHRLRLQSRDGRWRSYQVAKTDIVDIRQPLSLARDAGPALLLVTCWPFEAIRPGGPLRLVVTALPLREGPLREGPLREGPVKEKLLENGDGRPWQKTARIN